MHHFSTITLLITHYNRSRSLESLLDSFSELGCSFADIIVSDDSSQPAHINAIRDLQKRYTFRLITADKNKGLGNNINKGQKEVRTPYTLYVQEDFRPKPLFPTKLQESLSIMDNELTIDIARFYAYFNYPYLVPYENGFSKMLFKPRFWHWNHLKFYYYSDHPHLRRSNFLSKFGEYQEGLNVDKTEFKMCLSFIKNGGTGIFFNNFTDLFDQVNSSSEPSTASFRNAWRQYKNPLVLTLRWVYLRYRFVKIYYQLMQLKKSQTVFGN